MVKSLLEGFEYNLQRIPREENSRVDTLTKLVIAKATVNNGMIIQETLQIPCTNKVINVEEIVDDANCTVPKKWHIIE